MDLATSHPLGGNRVEEWRCVDIEVQVSVPSRRIKAVSVCSYLYITGKSGFLGGKLRALYFMIAKGHFWLFTSEVSTKLVQRDMSNLPIIHTVVTRKQITIGSWLYDKHRTRYRSLTMRRQVPRLPFLNACTVCMKTIP